MRGIAALTLLLLGFVISEGSKCRGRYQELRGKDQFIPRRGCRGLDSQIPEEYWASVGYDGALRDGRTTDDFLEFPVQENNGHRLKNSFIGYWITRTKYGEGQHYESFGHVFVKPNGRVCGWFVGLNREIGEVCGGFRVLSKSNRNRNEQIPFEWVQGNHLRNRDTLGFHRHRIAKYEASPDEIFFGDAQLSKKEFRGVSPQLEQFVETNSPNEFSTKVWLLRKKNLPINEDGDSRDPYYEARLEHMRRFPFYDKDGRPSGEVRDSHRPAYDSFDRRIPFQYYLRNFERNEQRENENNQDIRQKSRNYPHLDESRSEYEKWLRRQYELRGLLPVNSNNAEQERSRQVNYGEPKNEDRFDATNPALENQQNNAENNQNSEIKEKEKEEEKNSNNGSFVDIPLNKQNKQLLQLRKLKQVTVQDNHGNVYERKLNDIGQIYYVTYENGVEKIIDDEKLTATINKILEKRNHRLEKVRSQFVGKI